jgi:ABC-2 type transport system permease protein
MLANVFLKSLREQRTAFIWWTVGIIALCVMTVSLYPSVSQSQGVTEFLKDAPEWIKSMVGDINDFTTPAGYLNGRLFFLMAPILFLIFAISRGTAAIAGEEQAGTLDLLLSNPLPRWRVLMEKAAAMMVATLALGIAFWIGLALGTVAIGMDISYLRLADATFSCMLLGWVFGAIALSLGCASGKRGLTIGVTTALGVGAFFLYSLVPLAKSLEGLSKFSPFYYYAEAAPLKNGLNWLHVLVLIVATLFFIALSAFLFDRRDITV